MTPSPAPPFTRAVPVQARHTKWDDIPGPGTYNHVTDHHGSGFLGDAPCFSMGSRKTVPKPDDASPGPVYSPRMLTPHASGPIGDAALYSFGTSKRFEAGGSGDPGPGQYAQQSTRMGGTLMGDAPKFGFGTSSQRVANELSRGNRFISKEHATKSNYAVHSPGPLVYKMQDGFGTAMVGSGAPNSPRYSMRPRLSGRGNGTGAEGGIDQPGPGTYAQSPSFGAQVNSARASASSFSFGTSTRTRPELQPKKTMYIGKDYERQNWGTGSPRAPSFTTAHALASSASPPDVRIASPPLPPHPAGINSPGPAIYDTKHTVGNAPLQYKSQPSFSFGSESRFAY